MTGPGIVLLLASFSLITRVTGHSYNLGACPQFTPMPDFDWEKVKIIFLYLTLYCCPISVFQWDLVSSSQNLHIRQMSDRKLREEWKWLQVFETGDCLRQTLKQTSKISNLDEPVSCCEINWTQRGNRVSILCSDIPIQINKNYLDQAYREAVPARGYD